MSAIGKAVVEVVRGKLCQAAVPRPEPVPPEHIASPAPSATLPSVIINVDHDGAEVQPARLEPTPASLANTKDEAMPPVTLPTGAKP